jgi:hypothetical protein
MLSDLRFVLGYIFAVVVVVLSPPTKGCRTEAKQLFGRPHSSRQLVATFTVCANHSNMFSNRWFMLRYAFAVAVIMLLPPTEFWITKLIAHRLTTTHLDVLPRLQYAQIIPICPPTFALCSDMLS